MLCPVGAQLMFHPEGEVAVARAAKSKNALQILSTVTNLSVEDVAAARGGPGWFQLYSTSDWPATQRMLEARRGRGLHGASPGPSTFRRATSRPLERFDRDHGPAVPGVPRRHAGRSVRDAAHVRRRRHDEGAHGARRLELELRRAAQRRDEDEGAAERHPDARGRGAVPRSTASTASSSATTAAAPTRRCAARSTACPRSSRPSAGASRCSSTAASAAAPTSSKRSRSARRPSASAGRTSGAWARSAQPGVERVLDILTRELRIVMTQMGAAKIADISRSSIQPL